MWFVDEDGEFEDDASRDYVTHQQGEQAVHSDGVRRDTQDNKTLYTLMFPKGVPMSEQLIVRVAELYTRGGAKHGKRNWENSRAEDTLEHHTEALWRHFMKFFFDVQDGEDHAAAIVWNVNAVDLTRRNLAKAAADEHTKLTQEIERSHPLADAMAYFNQRFEAGAETGKAVRELLTWQDGDRLTEVDKNDPGSWLYSAGGDVWYFEGSEPGPAEIDRSARSLGNLTKTFGPLTVTRGRNKGWMINPDGSIKYGTGP